MPTDEAQRRAAAAANAEAARLGVHPPFHLDDESQPCRCLGQGCRERRGRALMRADFDDAHAEGLHDGLPREGCPSCAGRPR